jgi:hypothetical protein
LRGGVGNGCAVRGGVRNGFAVRFFPQSITEVTQSITEEGEEEGLGTAAP